MFKYTWKGSNPIHKNPKLFDKPQSIQTNIQVYSVGSKVYKQLSEFIQTEVKQPIQIWTLFGSN